MKAILKNHFQSPRKVRLIADAIRGMDVKKADTQLSFSTSKSALPIRKLLKSAVANAEQKKIKTDKMMIEKIVVNEGIKLRRAFSRSRGRVSPFKRRASTIEVVLKERA